MKVAAALLLVLALAMPVSALEIEAPAVPPAGEDWMPSNTQSFSGGLRELLGKVLTQLCPDLAEAATVSAGVLAAVFLGAVFQGFGISKTVDLVCCTAVAGLLLGSADAMLTLAADTIRELSDYGKLLFPVMTTAMAAQGGITGASALYAGTIVFDSLLSGVLAKWLTPLAYLFLALAVGNSATGEDLLKRLRDLVKSLVSWCLKTLLTVFTTYMSITGVVSGTADATALKAAKVTISSVVPVIGGVMSDASEAVLVSAGLMKNAAGIYGILAVLAIFLGPFLKIWSHYLILKGTAALCGIFGTKAAVELIGDFSAALGLLLAMTGAGCLLVLISTVCFMKGVG